MGVLGSIFQIEFDGLFEVCESLLFGTAEGGDVVVETLDDKIRILAIESVVDLSHGRMLRFRFAGGKSGVIVARGALVVCGIHA